MDARRANGDGYQEGYLVEVAEESINAWRPVVLHAAVGLLEQAKSQTLYTQVVNYNAPLKHYNSKHSYLQYLAMFRGMVCEIEGYCFEFWSWGAVLGKWNGVGAGLYQFV